MASQVGSGAMPVEELKSVALRVTHPEKSANAIAAMFRRARIIGRVADDSFHLDLRTIEDPVILLYVIAGVTTDDLARPRPSFVLLTL